MTDRIPCEFFLFRYVPDVVREEFVNIGVFLREEVGSATPLLRFTRNWSRVQAVNPDADIALLEALEADMSNRIRIESATSVLEELLDSLSNALQITGPHACLADTLETELDRLMRLYVESPNEST